MEKIINIAVIAHVDAGKSTLVDAFLSQSKTMEASNQVMDSNDLERERGITIYAKNCSIMYKDTKINIIDTPGHADFSSEVERIIKTVDTVILLVDSAEGVMPQTRFVLQKSLEIGIKPILLINKIDKPDRRVKEVIDEVVELFFDLDANEDQLEFPTLYGIAKEGIIRYEENDESQNDLSPLFETLIKHVEIKEDLEKLPLQLQVSALAYDDYIGRLGMGRIYQGSIKEGQQVIVHNAEGQLVKQKVTKLFVYKGLHRVSVTEAFANDIVVVAGISDIMIGETLCDIDNPQPLPLIEIENPTMSMNFLVNKSPFAGKEGKYLTTRNIKDRLDKELEVNVGLRVEPLSSAADGYKVSGRGELHLSILLENMRREGFEIAVSKPEVIFKMIDDRKCEPIERVIVEVPEIYSGSVINSLNNKKGEMVDMYPKGSQTRIEYLVPTRSLIGYASTFINETHGEGIMVKNFDSYQPYKGKLEGRKNGVFVSALDGEAMGYSLMNLSERGQMMILPGTKVYEGMVVGINSRDNDLIVNACKNKKLTNVRSSGNDDAIKVPNPKIMNLEEALEFIEDDELVEITPTSIRVRKKFLKENDRKRSSKEVFEN